MTLSLILQSKGRDVVTVSSDQSLRDVVATLSRLKIGAVLVVDQWSQVRGIFSERDVVRVVARSDTGLLDTPVSDHMTTHVETATPDSSVLDAMGRMTAGRFRHLPVVDGGRLAGLVSIGDLVKHRISEIEHENRAMRDYITTAA